jgi:hypothetical protein
MYQCFVVIDTGIEINSLLTAKLLNIPGLDKYICSALKIALKRL